ncbi:hypothetical protein [Rhizobium wenxiniae]|uniref:hypothetical protein n=1 Tax=Rhizobium wenxiniae TaxID=1737357 RepID=UPI003C1DED2B
MSDELSIRFFNGPPVADDLLPGQAGVNASLIDQLILTKPDRNPHWHRLVFHIFMKPEPDGTVPANPHLAEVIGVHHTTVIRQKKNLEALGLIYRTRLIGEYAYHPDIVLVRTKEGRVVNHPRYGRLDATADNPGINLSV